MKRYKKIFKEGINYQITNIMKKEIAHIKEQPYYKEHLTPKEQSEYIKDYIKTCFLAKKNAYENNSRVWGFLGRQNWMTDEDVEFFKIEEKLK